MKFKGVHTMLTTSFRANVYEFKQTINLAQFVSRVALLSAVILALLLAFDSREHYNPSAMLAASAACLVIAGFAWLIKNCYRLSGGAYYFLASLGR